MQNKQNSEISYTFNDGEVKIWSGKSACLCSSCREIFNSVAAFEAHNKKGNCDTSKMFNNNRGLWVTALMDKKALKAKVGA